MGFFFSIQHANIVAYLTDSRQVTPPRMTVHDLWTFLGAAGEGRRFFANRGFVSSDHVAEGEVALESQRAFDAVDQLLRTTQRETWMEDAFVIRTLSGLKQRLTAYDLFGLTVRGDGRDEELTAFALNAAYSSGARALILITACESPKTPLEFLDPFPALAPLVEDLGQRPGMLFWDLKGNSLYAPLNDAHTVFGQLLQALRGGWHGAIEDVLERNRRVTRPKRILHLSDLHLGTIQAAENQQLLLQRLRRVVPTVDRIVITGDLFDEPKREYSIHFQNFSFALRQFSSKPPVIIPGNHDQKTLGNVARNLREVADLDWEKLVVDDDMGAVFFCFDSSRDAAWARGKVTTAQRRDVAVEYEARANERLEIEGYLRVALVHHHPFSFLADEQSLLNRGLRWVGKTDESFLCMEDGDEFVDWCARRGIPLILHGHKHIPRHVCRDIWVEGARQPRNVNAVGCGTSLGAEGKPLSYNVVTYDHDSQRAGVSCFADPGDGGGFVGTKLVAFDA